MTRFIKSNWKFILIVLAFLGIGTYFRYTNLWNVGSFFDLIVTQYDWGKVHYEIGPLRFWQEYDKTLDYMPAAMYIDWAIYGISRAFGGGEQTFVTVMKVFNWIIDILFCIFIYKVAGLNKTWGKNFKLGIATFAYAVPSIWSVTGIWGQFDTLVALIGIIALIFYFYSNEKPSEFVLGNFWLKLHRYFPFFSGTLIGLGYWLKPTGMIILPVILMLLVHRLDWKGLWKIFAGFLVVSIPFATIPLMANPYKLLYIMTLPLFGFGVNNASRDATTFWYLIGQEGYVGTTLFSFGGIKLTVYHFALMIFVGWMGLILIKFFGLNKGLNIREFFTKRFWNVIFSRFFEKNITLFDIALITTIISYVYFLFYIKMLSRYLMPGILASLILLALWKKGKKFWWYFTFIFFTHICFFLNQIYIVNNGIPLVEQVKSIFPFNYMYLISTIYLISWVILSMIFWQKMDDGKEQ